MTLVADLTITALEPEDHGDIEGARGVLQRANAQFDGLVPAPLYAAYAQDVLDVGSRLARSRTLLAKQGGRVVGTVTYFRDANDEGMGPRVPAGTAGIRAVAVDPEARGAGIGRRLAAAAIELAREDGAPAIVLHTWFVMRAAIRVYESVGFRRRPAYDADSATFFPWSGEDDPPALAFWLDL